MQYIRELLKILKCFVWQRRQNENYFVFIKINLKIDETLNTYQETYLQSFHSN